MNQNWVFNENDEKMAQNIRDFLPDIVFDGHSHLYRVKDLNIEPPNLFTEGPEEAGYGEWKERMSEIFRSECLKGGLFFPFPKSDLAVDEANSYLLEQIQKNPDNRGLIVVTPDYPEKDILRWIQDPQIIGFKPYHCFSPRKPTLDASILEFMPEHLWEIADEYNLVITMHLVKNSSITDPENQNTLREMCLRYPNTKVILAHAARSFHAPHAEKGIPSLRGLSNIWFDTALICEAEALNVILYEFGPRKLLYGSDFPADRLRGKCVTVGHGFAWLQYDTILWDNLSVDCRPVLAGLESLRALRTAARNMGLNRDDLKDIFYENAAGLFGISREKTNVTQTLYDHAKQHIPGGTQLFSKRAENMAPGLWPAYFREARGCEVWDLDGRHYFDMSTNSVGACLLGYRDPDVTDAVIRRISLGNISSLNPPEEVELADRLLEIHPWAEQVRYTRAGGEACALAVRIARATTGRSLVAVGGYHGWHDWYIAANLNSSDALKDHLIPGVGSDGVPPELDSTTVTFRFNDSESYEQMIRRHGNRLAAVVMEPCHFADPLPGYLAMVKKKVQEAGALLIFDEVSIGWRLTYGGSHLTFGVNPDIAVFAKALGNGHPIGAVIGTSRAMQGAHTSFISSTYWTEGTGPAAAIATLEKMGRIDVPAHVKNVGLKVIEFWKEHAEQFLLPVDILPSYPCIIRFKFKNDKENKLRTLYTQLMLEKGFLAIPALFATLAHTDEILNLYGTAIKEVFQEMARIIEQGSLDNSLNGTPARSGFYRLDR